MMYEKFLFNEKDSIKAKALEDSKFERFVGIEDSNKLNQENLIVTGQESKDDGSGVGCQNSSLRDVVSTSRGVALTLGDIISMEDSQNPPNNNNSYNINEHGENVDHETEQGKTDEPKAENLTYLSSEMLELKNQRQDNVLEDYYVHNCFSSNFSNGVSERSFFEAESGLAHITYSGPISVSGNLSVRSDGSTLTIGMGQQSCKNGEI